MNHPVLTRVAECSWHRTRAAALVVAAVLAFLLMPESGRAWESSLLGSLAVKEEYNDNIFLDVSGRRQSDFITTVSPGLEWGERTERLDFRLNGLVNAIRYLRYGGYDSVDYDAQFNARYRWTPRAELSAGGGLSRDSRPDRDLVSSGIILGTVPRDRWFYTAGGKYALSEKEGLEANYFQSKDTFHDPRFADMDAKTGALAYVRDLNDLLPLWKGKAQFSYGDYSFPNFDASIADYSAMVGAGRDLSERWAFSANAGVRYSRSKFMTQQVRFIPPFFLVLVQERKVSEGWGWIGDVSLTYRGDRSGGEVGFREDISPGSGVGVTERTSLRLSLYHRLTPELQLTFAAEYYRNQAGKNQFSATEYDYQVWNVGPGLRYEYTRQLVFDFSYSFTRLENKVAHTDGERNLFLIRVTLQDDLIDLAKDASRWIEKIKKR